MNGRPLSGVALLLLLGVLFSGSSMPPAAAEGTAFANVLVIASGAPYDASLFAAAGVGTTVATELPADLSPHDAVFLYTATGSMLAPLRTFVADGGGLVATDTTLLALCGQSGSSTSNNLSCVGWFGSAARYVNDGGVARTSVAGAFGSGVPADATLQSDQPAGVYPSLTGFDPATSRAVATWNFHGNPYALETQTSGGRVAYLADLYERGSNTQARRDLAIAAIRWVLADNPASQAPPVTTATFDGMTGTAGWYTSNVTVTLTCAPPAGESCAQTWYRLDDGTPTIYDGAFVLGGDGEHGLAYWSETSSTSEPAHDATVRIDATPPEVAVLGGCNVTGLAGWCRDAAGGLTPLATDATSGLFSRACTQDGNTTACPDVALELAARLPSRLQSPATAWDGTHAYVFGGRAPMGNGGYSTQILRFHPASGVVQTMNATMPRGFSQASAVAAGSHVYVFGGFNGSGERLDQILRYDPVADRVEAIPERLPTARSGTSAFWDGESAYVLGGVRWGGASGPTDEIVRYTPATGEVAVVARLPVPAQRTAAAWDGSSAHVFVVDFAQPSPSPVYRFTPSDGIVHTTNASVLEAPMAAAWDGARVILFVDLDDNVTTGAEIAYYDPLAGTAAPTGLTLPRVGQDASAIWDGAAAYLFGGYNRSDGHYSDEIRRFGLAPIPVGQGEHTVCIDATDAAGNLGRACANLAVDGAPPTVSLQAACSHTLFSGWCRDTAATVTTAATDNGSGVGIRTCTVDAVEAACEGIVVGQGAHEVCTFAFDVAGNPASLCKAVLMDATPPRVDIAIGACQLPGDRGWCMDSTLPVTMQMTDDVSGIRHHICYEPSPWSAFPTCDFSVGQGRRGICGNAGDNAGFSKTNCTTLRLDAVPPTATPFLDCPSWGREGWCQAPHARLRIDIVETSSQVARMGCTVDSVPVACPSGDDQAITLDIVGGTLADTHEAAAVWTGAHLYFFGGASYGGPRGDTILRYDATTGAIETMPTRLPTPLTRAQAVWTGSEALIFGGCGPTGCNVNEIYRYDPVTGAIRSANATLPAYYSPSVAWDGRYAYLFGGSGGGPASKAIVRYDPVADRVVTMQATLPTPRLFTTAVWTGEAFYVFGGDGGSGPSDQIVRYDPRGDVVEVVPTRLASPLWLAASAWDGRHAYVFGGYNATAASVSVMRFDPSTGELLVMGARVGGSRIAALWDGADVLLAGSGSLRRYSPPASFAPPQAEHAFCVSPRDFAGHAGAQACTTSKLDSVPPSLSPRVEPAPNARGWHSTQVRVSWDCSDETSGVASASGEVTLAHEGADQVAAGECVDVAGNAARVDTPGIHVDVTPPTFAGAPDVERDANAPGGAHVAFEPPAAEDALSGIRSVACDRASGSFFPLGRTTVSCVAYDLADNLASISFDVVVAATALARIELDGPPEVVAGTSATFTLAGYDAHGNAVALSRPSFEFVAPTSAGPHHATFEESGVVGTRPVLVVHDALDAITIGGPDEIVAGRRLDLPLAGSDRYGNTVALAHHALTVTAPTHLGTMEASYTEAGVAASRTLAVIAGPLARIDVEGPGRMVAGSTATFGVTGYDEFGNVVALAVAGFDYVAPASAGHNEVSYLEAGVVGTRVVEVVADTLARIEVSGPTTMVAGTRAEFALAGFDRFGNPVGLATTSFEHVASTRAGMDVAEYLELGVKGRAVLEVVPDALASIVVEGAPRIVAGTAGTYVPSGFDAYGNQVPLAHDSFEFAAPTVAGPAIVRYGESGVEGSLGVEVVPDALHVLVLDGPRELVAGAIAKYHAIGYDRHGNAVELSIDEILFTAPTRAGPALVTHLESGIVGTFEILVLPDALARIEATGPGSIWVGYAATFAVAGFDVHGNAVARANTDVEHVAPTVVGRYEFRYEELGVEAREPYDAVLPPVARVEAAVDFPLANVGQKRQISAIAYDPNGRVIPLAPFLFSCGTCTVSPAGEYVANSAGDDWVVVSSAGTQGAVRIQVVRDLLVRVELDDAELSTVHGLVSGRVHVRYQDGDPVRGALVNVTLDSVGLPGLGFDASASGSTNHTGVFSFRMIAKFTPPGDYRVDALARSGPNSGAAYAWAEAPSPAVPALAGS